MPTLVAVGMPAVSLRSLGKHATRLTQQVHANPRDGLASNIAIARTVGGKTLLTWLSAAAARTRPA